MRAVGDVGKRQKKAKKRAFKTALRFSSKAQEGLQNRKKLFLGQTVTKNAILQIEK